MSFKSEEYDTGCAFHLCHKNIEGALAEGFTG